MSESRLRILPREAPRNRAGKAAPSRAGRRAAVPETPREAYLALAREHVTVPADELDTLVIARLGLDPADPATEVVLAAVDHELADDPESPLTHLTPDVVVHIPALLDGAVLTHRLTAAERAGGHLDLGPDLGAFLRFPQPRTAAGELVVGDPGPDPADPEPVAWIGPDGWLAHLPVDAVLAVRVTGTGVVTIEVLDAAPAPSPELVTALRAAYDAEVVGVGLPLFAEDLVVGVRYRDRTAFTEPGPSLTELAAAAGLERRGHEFAHEESVWVKAATADRQYRFIEAVATDEQGAAAEAAFVGLTGTGDPAELRRVLDRLEDPEVIEVVADELLHPDGDPERVAALVALADRLVGMAGSSPRAAVAYWLAAVAAERDGRVFDAESHLRAASVAAPGWELVEDRLAWYESDRGDAAAALGRWTSIETPDDDPDVAMVRRFAAGPAVDPPGRNEPCWCGSGRKFKQCHLGRPVTAALPARADWLYRKAVAYLERRGGAPSDTLFRHAEVLAGPPADLPTPPAADPTPADTPAAADTSADTAADADEAALAAAYADPLTADTALHEGGWFAGFLADRGPLLPADEAELAATWPAVARTVYEVLDADPAGGLTLRDLRTGHHLAVTEPVVGPAATTGGLLCARALPDGAGGHRLLGATFAVPPGREQTLLAALDGPNVLDLLDQVVALRA